MSESWGKNILFALQSSGRCEGLKTINPCSCSRSHSNVLTFFWGGEHKYFKRFVLSPTNKNNCYSLLRVYESKSATGKVLDLAQTGLTAITTISSNPRIAITALFPENVKPFLSCKPTSLVEHEHHSHGHMEIDLPWSAEDVNKTRAQL